MAYGKKDQVAFSGNYAYAIMNAISNVASKLLSLEYQQFTGDELLTLFIDPEHHDPLKQAWDLTKGNNVGTQVLYVKSEWAAQHNGVARIALQWDYRNMVSGFFVPLKQGGKPETAVSVRPEAPAELREKFTTMADAITRISYEWGMVRFVFQQLNQHGYCNTPAQMRYIWPAIVPLLRYAGHTQLAADLTQPSSRAGDKARIPAAARDLIKPSADVVTRSLLLDMASINQFAQRPEPHIRVNDPEYEVAPGVSFSGMV